MTRWHHRKELEDLEAVGGHCPRCGAEYRPGFTTCADCYVPLVPGPAKSEIVKPEPEEEPEQRDWWDRAVSHRPKDDTPTEPAEVAQLPLEEAWLLAGRLRADGIPATVYPPDPATISRSYGLIRLHSVLVPRELLETALELVQPYVDGGNRPGR